MSVSQIAPRQKRIGVFGGAFDPPHKAHLELAKVAITQLELDELRVVPTGHAWHKARELSSAGHRLAMTRLTFEGMPRVVVDEREMQRAGPTFTIDTLEALQSENPGAQLYLIMGADQFAAFRQWHRWQAIVGLAIICIAGRATSTVTQAQIEAYGMLKSRFLQLSLPPMIVSATHIRQLLASGAGQSNDINELVPEAVARYISANRVYGTP
ncbi:nicotinate (nicotinamide) nucleotide adenylyltransferase [Polaromonas sp.]|uniref:nicotinate (nicotinamide) nucleotide adenylyltransferase n=1 Tax=Polaromonas sp. TaxID=1869339 RepID=UPI0025CBDC2C|nr:nicotinate (nicotinamide) nucleotide adenylyltransferase [Polaromonas sp.]